MTNRRARVSLVVTVVAAGMVAPAVWAAPSAAGAVAAPGVAGPTVTLVTGDKVTVGGAYGVTVRAAKGREHIGFRTHTDEHGDVHVLPDDAVPLLSQGKLDPRLFDVTELARVGYDDASRDTLPLIVDFPGRTPRVAGAQVDRELPAMSATAVSVARSADFWATAKNAEHVWLDGPVRASLDRSVSQIGAPEAWNAGHTGEGVTVAVLDTGIDVTHPDLSDAVVDAQNFTDTASADDGYGHGTHVASIITGSGGRYTGVAPDAKLLNGKVLNDAGGGLESWIIAGMAWAAGSGADVVNMSLGTRWPSDGADPMSQALNRLTTETGTLFVVAAGNSGEEVGAPGAADAALTVGAVDRNDQLARFSSRGRWRGGIKPDITAPGVGIVAAKAANGQIGTPAADGYVSLSGTSMATPHVAGAAAILAGQHPDWQAGQLKATLMGTAKPNDTLTVFEQGAGRVDVAKASASTVFAEPASLDNGFASWPHDDDQPITKTITYTNTGTEPVTLDLAADVTGPGESGAPQGMLTFTPARLTVPAGGQATTTVVTDTTVDAVDGQYGGAVTATGGNQSVRTPIAVHREVESYDVTVKFVDSNGLPAGPYLSDIRFVNVDQPKVYEGPSPSDTIVLRLPKGEYAYDATIMTNMSETEEDYVSAHFIEPAFVVSGDTSLVLDAREAERLGLTVDKPNAKTGYATFQFALPTAWGFHRATRFIPTLDRAYVKPSTTRMDTFTFAVEAHLAEWNGESFENSPYLYHVRHTEHGTVPQTLRWSYETRQLAKVRSTHAVITPGTFGIRDTFLPIRLPATLTEYYTPDVPWYNELWETESPEVNGEWTARLVTNEPRSFPLGRTTTERWNVGVHGPAFPNGDYSEQPFAARYSDQINVDLPLTTDQGRSRAGFPELVNGVTTLLRDGKVVGEFASAGFGRFPAAPENAEYTLRTSVSRTGSRLSTQVSAEWTFTSERHDGDDPVDLPLLAVRFAPALDDHNEAPAGKRFTFPVFVQRNGGPVGTVNAPAVEVSYDDGATWRTANLNRAGAGWKATVDHPAGAEFVSLRSSIADQDGNTQQQTILRAYALK